MEQEQDQHPDSEDTAALKLVIEEMNAYRKVAENQVVTMGRIADALESHSKAMARLADAAEHYLEQQFHSVR